MKCLQLFHLLFIRSRWFFITKLPRRLLGWVIYMRRRFVRQRLILLVLPLFGFFAIYLPVNSFAILTTSTPVCPTGTRVSCDDLNPAFVKDCGVCCEGGVASTSGFTIPTTEQIGTVQTTGEPTSGDNEIDFYCGDFESGTLSTNDAEFAAPSALIVHLDYGGEFNDFLPSNPTANFTCGEETFNVAQLGVIPKVFCSMNTCGMIFDLSDHEGEFCKMNSITISEPGGDFIGGTIYSMFLNTIDDGNHLCQGAQPTETPVTGAYYWTENLAGEDDYLVSYSGWVNQYLDFGSCPNGGEYWGWAAKFNTNVITSYDNWSSQWSNAESDFNELAGFCGTMPCNKIAGGGYFDTTQSQYDNENNSTSGAVVNPLGWSFQNWGVGNPVITHGLVQLGVEDWPSDSHGYGGVKGQVIDFRWLCHGTYYSPTATVNSTQYNPTSPVSCDNWQNCDNIQTPGCMFRSTEPVVDWVPPTIESGECFTLLPSIGQTNLDIWGWNITLGWPRVDFCPQWVTFGETTIIGFTIPLDAIISLIGVAAIIGALLLL